MSIELDGCAKVGMGAHLCEGIWGYESGDGGNGGDKGGVDGVSKMGNWAFEKVKRKHPPCGGCQIWKNKTSILYFSFSSCSSSKIQHTRPVKIPS